MALAGAVIGLAGVGAYADRLAYQGSVTLEARSADLIAVHAHDWSKLREEDGSAALRFSQTNPFGVSPDISSIELRRLDGGLVARLSSPPLTYLTFTEDGRYLIGLSNIKYLNDTQLLVVDSHGVVQFRHRISPEFGCMSDSQFAAFRKKYPKPLGYLEQLGRVVGVPVAWRYHDNVYVDAFATDGTREFHTFSSALYSLTCRSPWSDHFSESVTNYISWYDEMTPHVQMIESDGVPQAVSLRDPSGVEINVPLRLDVLLPSAHAPRAGPH